jgi:hypothetical protein
MNPTQSSTALPNKILVKLGRLFRFVVFLCTAGWLYPHACTEGMDLTRIQNENKSGRR